MHKALILLDVLLSSIVYTESFGSSNLSPLTSPLAFGLRLGWPEPEVARATRADQWPRCALVPANRSKRKWNGVPGSTHMRVVAAAVIVAFMAGPAFGQDKQVP